MKKHIRSFTEEELNRLVELLRVAAIHCQELAATVFKTFPDSPLVERQRMYAEYATDLIDQLLEAQS